VSMTEQFTYGSLLLRAMRDSAPPYKPSGDKYSSRFPYIGNAGLAPAAAEGTA
jgi:hypothetical protein